MAKVLHDLLWPHNINGWGKITLCPNECPAHEQWAAEQMEKK